MEQKSVEKKSPLAHNLSHNLRKLMSTANLNEHELSRRTNIKQPIIHRLLSGENKNPKLQTIKPIADYFLLTVSQLIGEEANILSSGFTSNKHYGWTEVPLINSIESLLSEQKVNTECKVSKNTFAAFILDQSMEPLFPEKCLVIVEPNIKAESGDYVMLKNSKNELILRNFLLISGEKYINPLNNRYGTICKLSDEEKVIGVVIRSIYDYK